MGKKTKKQELEDGRDLDYKNISLTLSCEHVGFFSLGRVKMRIAVEDLKFALDLSSG